MIDVEPLIRTQLESLMPLPEASRCDWADVLERSGHHNRVSRRRLFLALAAGVCVLVVTGAAIAAGLGAFSGNTTNADLDACKASTIALTTASGAQVLTGHTDVGVYCVAYKEADGVVAGSSAKLGETPVGQAVAVGTFDTASDTRVIAAVVPPGYDMLTVGSTEIPIKNAAFVLEARLATAPAVLSGPAGTATINLSAFAAP